MILKISMSGSVSLPLWLVLLLGALAAVAVLDRLLVPSVRWYLRRQVNQVIDVNQWLRVMAYEQLVGVADAWFTGANIHNFRVYVRPQDQRALFMPWDWDSCWLASPTAPLLGSGNIAKLLGNANRRRNYLHQVYDLVTSTYNTAYMTRWINHYAAIGGQHPGRHPRRLEQPGEQALQLLPVVRAGDFAHRQLDRQAPHFMGQFDHLSVVALSHDGLLASCRFSDRHEFLPHVSVLDAR